MNRLAFCALRGCGLAALFVFTTAGLPSNGLPSNGLPSNGLPSNGLPSNGLPSNGLPSNGANLDWLEHSLLFGNPPVHKALIGRAFTQANLTDATSPVSKVWYDPFSILLLSYLWQDAHAAGDDLVFDNPVSGETVHFYGNVGACKNGWALNTPLDDTCARWLSALIITQVNQSGIHNLFSARGPSSAATGFIGSQLTDMSPAVSSYTYKFGTHDPVEAVSASCPAGTTGPANCGWQTGIVGTCSPGARVRVSLASSGIVMLAQANQGIMAHNYPWAPKGSCAGAPAGCTDPDVLANGAGVNPSVHFACPASGVFNVQWTDSSRAALAGGVLPVMKAVARGGSVRFPANELDVFPNRELTASGNIFGEANIDPALWSCEARLVYNQRQTPEVLLCLASNQRICVPCDRGFRQGALHVLFPNAHLWLSANWTNAQAYYQNRSCSSDLSTCIARFEGYIDAFSFNAATGHFVPPCRVQSADRDAHRPLPYPGRPRRLHDANFCSVDTAVKPFFAVTTFFPNYNNIGACAAVGPKAAASCAYARPCGEDDDDDEEDDHRDRDHHRDRGHHRDRD